MYWINIVNDGSEKINSSILEKINVCVKTELPNLGTQCILFVVITDGSFDSSMVNNDNLINIEEKDLSKPSVLDDMSSSLKLLQNKHVSNKNIAIVSIVPSSFYEINSTGNEKLIGIINQLSSRCSKNLKIESWELSAVVSASQPVIPQLDW